MNKKQLMVLAVIELALSILAVVLDLLIPSIVICATGLVFLLLRKEPFSVLGFKKQQKPFRMIIAVFLLTIVWTLVDFGLLLPVLNHLTGTTQDLSGFSDLKGNLGKLAFLVVASWTLAAIGEELAYRGFVQLRIRSLFANAADGLIVSIIASSVLFGFAHLEQGVIGVVITAIDAVFFSLIRKKFDNLWASVLAHGFMNTIGMVVFFFTGPLYGLW